MQTRGGGGKTNLLTGPIHHKQGSNLTDASLDRLQPDQLPIQLIQHGLNSGPLVGLLQVDFSLGGDGKDHRINALSSRGH